MIKSTQLTAGNNAAAPDLRHAIHLVATQDYETGGIPGDDPNRSGIVIVFGFMVFACALTGALVSLLR